MTNIQVGMSAEDIPLLGGVALAIAGTYLKNTDLILSGLALIGGKAVLKSSPPAAAPASTVKS